MIKEKVNSTNLGSNQISISDALILYMGDSFNWVSSLWNGKDEKRGLNYYGETIIKDENLIKLKEIIFCWIQLFELSTEKLILTGNYLLEENKYEKNCFNKRDVLLQLKSLYFLCEKAIEKNGYIMHNGI